MTSRAAVEAAIYKLTQIDPVCYQGCKREILEVIELLRAQPPTDALPVELEGLEKVLRDWKGFDGSGPSRAININSRVLNMFIEAAHHYAQSPARVNRELLDKIIELSHSHVDGRFLFEPLLHRKQLDIKKRLDGVESWYEGDWLSDLGRAIKDAYDKTIAAIDAGGGG